MVAVAAFLIICVLLFGLENVRGFFFGTLGVVGWAIFGILALGTLLMFVDWLGKEAKDECKNAKKRKEHRLACKKDLAELKVKNPKQYRKIQAKKALLVLYIGLPLVAAIALVAVLLLNR